MKRLVIMLFAFSLVFLFASCKDEVVNEETDVVTEAPKPSLSISGIDVSEFTIVYSNSAENGEAELASLLSDRIFDIYGVRVPVVDDSGATPKHSIFIGRTAFISETMRVSAVTLETYKLDLSTGMLYSAEGQLWVICSGIYNTKAAVQRLVADIELPEGKESLDLDYSSGLAVATDELREELKIMSYNVQTGNASKVTPRVPLVINHVKNFDADVVGTQEINYIWLEELEKKGFLDTYTRIGEAREGDKRAAGNEYSCIFYKTDKFNLIDSGTYWLSDTPEEISKLADCDYYRVMTFAVLERKSDGFKFLHVNSHLEWDHGAVETNRIQTDIMLGLADGLLQKHGDMPVYYTGDFNVEPTSNGYALMLEKGNEDARSVADATTQSYTFSSGKILDYCFVSKGDFAVSSFKVGRGYTGSDHYPVFVILHPFK